MDPDKILEPVRERTGRDLEFTLLSSLFPNINTNSQKFHQILGDYIIFQAPIFQQINERSAPFAHEGYGMQGSRMFYHRRDAVSNHFKQTLKNPARNFFLLVRDRSTQEILGSVSLLNNAKGGPPELADFYLSPELRRHPEDPKVGIAKYFLTRTVNFARNIGHKSIFLNSRRKGGFEAALSLFRQLGFKELTDNREINRLVSHKYQSSRTIAMLMDLTEPVEKKKPTVPDTDEYVPPKEQPKIE